MNMNALNKQFPILNTTSYEHPLVYLDNAATTQKPECVIDAVANYYRTSNANVHRGAYALSVKATDAYEHAREAVQTFINAPSPSEIIFTKGTTESINLVASTFGRMRLAKLKKGGNIVISGMEHHSNLLPWQALCRENGAELRVIPIETTSGTLNLDSVDSIIDERTAIVAITHVSNALGTINPISKIIERAHRQGVPVLVDGAQAVAHLPVDVQALDCDFYAFSGHKMYGPTGIGVLFAKRAHLDAMPPYQYGGEMVEAASFENATFAPAPQKFEAGTPNIAGAVGLHEAIRFITEIGLERIQEHEASLLKQGRKALECILGVNIIGTARENIGIISFTMSSIHPHDIATILDHEGIAIRAGHHCAQPLMDTLSILGTARVSFAIYNTEHDIDILVRALAVVEKTFHTHENDPVHEHTHDQ